MRPENTEDVDRAKLGLRRRVKVGFTFGTALGEGLAIYKRG